MSLKKGISSGFNISKCSARVTELVRPVAVLIEELAVLLGELAEGARRNAQAHHLRVPEGAVVRQLNRVVVADLAVLRAGEATGVAAERGELPVAAAEDAPLGLHELVLHVPEAAAAEVNLVSRRFF